MKKTGFTRIVAIVLVAVTLLGFIAMAATALNASATSQAEINKLKEESEVLADKKNEILSEINSLEYEQLTITAQKEVLDEKIILTQAEVDNLTEQIAVYDGLIEEKAEEVEVAKKQEADQWELYKVRMRAMEENGAISYLAILFDASSFIDLLAKIDFIGEVMQRDEELYQEYQDAKLHTIAAKLRLEETQREQIAAREALEVKKKELEDEVAEADKLLQQLEESLEKSYALYQETLAAENEVQEEIKKLEEELKKQQAAAGGSAVVGGGTFSWPTPSCMYVTSEFGMRLHPIYGYYRMHNGIDIGATYGSNIVASDAGTVITSTYNSSYGNYVVVSHGNGYTTLYAHMSSRAVSAGDIVYAGEVIGYVGSTGASTGPHLHYEISYNGTRQNPLNYFSGYVIW